MVVQKLKLYGLKQSDDGRFQSEDYYALIQANNMEEAKMLADEITHGSFSKYGGFYELSRHIIKIYSI